MGWDVCLSITLPLSTPYPQRQKTVTLGGSENSIPPLRIEPNLETNANTRSERQNRGETERERERDRRPTQRKQIAKKKKAVLYNLIFYFNKGVYYHINVAKNLG